MNVFNKKLLIFIASLIFFLPITVSAQTLVDKIIVIVNEDVITENDLEKRIARTKATSNINELDQKLRDRILKSMVEELVQLQTAKRAGIQVSEAEVDKLVQIFFKQKKTTAEELEAKLVGVGLDLNDLRDAMKTQSMLTKLIRSDAVRSVKVSDEEIETFADAYNIKPSEPEYDVSYLFVESSNTDDDQKQTAVLNIIKSVQSQLQSSDLNQLSTALTAEQIDVTEKSLGFNPPEKLPSIFATTVAKMSPGKLSEPFKTSGGIYVLKLNNIRGGVAATEKRKAQHILVKAETQLEVERAKKTIERLMTQINAGTKFENIAKFYSDDSGSAATGGDLGWVRKGQMVPRFDAKLFSMAEGEISEPVVTNFGVHVIKLNEISKVVDPNEQRREVAYNNLMSQKVDQYFPTFLSKLLGRAYIRYL